VLAGRPFVAFESLLQPSGNPHNSPAVILGGRGYVVGSVRVRIQKFGEAHCDFSGVKFGQYLPECTGINGDEDSACYNCFPLSRCVDCRILVQLPGLSTMFVRFACAITGTAGCLRFHPMAHLWLSVLCMRSKAWLAARVSLRLACLPRTASSAQRSCRLCSPRVAAPVLLAHAEVTKNIKYFSMGPKLRHPAVLCFIIGLIDFQSMGLLVAPHRPGRLGY
jgi:hypothetical protein